MNKNPIITIMHKIDNIRLKRILMNITYWYPIRWMFWKKIIDEEYGECHQLRKG